MITSWPRKAGKQTRLIQEQNRWMALLAERTRFVTPDGKVWRMDRLDTYQQGRIVGLVEDEHGKDSIRFISTWSPVAWLAGRRK